MIPISVLEWRFLITFKTNQMFKSSIVVPEYANLLGWREHHDPNEVSLPVTLTVTETGEYYQQKHPALRLDLIQALIPENQKLTMRY